jgi:hypothetical protein
MCRSAPLRTSIIEQLLEEEHQQQDIQFDEDPVESEPSDTLDYIYFHQEEEEEEQDLYALAQEEGRQWAVYQGVEPPRNDEDHRSICDAMNRGLGYVFGVDLGSL